MLDRASRLAEHSGRELNTCIDINWDRTSAADDPDGKLLRLTLKRLRRWLARFKVELHALWIRENPKGGPRGSPKPGAHIMLHLPPYPPMLFRQLQMDGPDLLPEGCNDLDGRAVKIHPTGITPNARITRVVRYLGKGASKNSRIAAELGIKPEDQGRIYGKRCGVTENLSPPRRSSARRLDAVASDNSADAPAAPIKRDPIFSGQTGVA